MEIRHVGDPAVNRAIERFEAQQAQQDGLIDYVACMADVDMPESDDDNSGKGAGHDAQ